MSTTPLPFRQFEVEAKELELKRLLAEGERHDKAADEVMCTCRCRRLGVVNIIFASPSESTSVCGGPAR